MHKIISQQINKLGLGKTPAKPVIKMFGCKLRCASFAPHSLVVGTKSRNMTTNLFTWACNEIETADKRLGHKLSWRFLTTPARTLSPSTRIAFIALNPGGNKIPLDHGRESSEVGSAYIYEKWRSVTLQQQVQALFRQIADQLTLSNHQSLMNNSLMAYYIPFRSPNFRSLHRQAQSRDFALRLWSCIMKQISPELVMSIDKTTFHDIHTILVSAAGLKQTYGQKLPTGWGKYTATINFYADKERHVVLVRLPHLSRFKIFNRPASEPYVRNIVKEMTQFMT